MVPTATIQRNLGWQLLTEIIEKRKKKSSLKQHCLPLPRTIGSVIDPILDASSEFITNNNNNNNISPEPIFVDVHTHLQKRENGMWWNMTTEGEPYNGCYVGHND